MFKVMYFIFSFVLVSVNYSQENSVYSPIKIAQNNPQIQEIQAKYGDLWISFSSNDQKFLTGTGKEHFIIETVYYYYKQNEKYLCLGSVDKNGLYDKEGRLIFPINIKQSEKLGISSKLLESPFAPCLVIKTKDGLIKETNAVVLIDLNISTDSISVFSPEHR